MNDKLESTNPATGDVVGTYVIADTGDVDNAVASARQAAAWWSALSFDERKEILSPKLRRL